MGLREAPPLVRSAEQRMMTHEAAIMVILGKMCDNLPLHRQKDRMERTRDYSPPILKLPDLMIPPPARWGA